jgi:SAM-dependent methyltransferase
MRFEEKAGGYRAHATPQRRLAEALAAFAPFSKGERVTELGAGTGFLTQALLAQGAVVDASDASPAMVSEGSHAAPSAIWSVQDAFGEIFPAHNIASSGMLQWAPDPVAVLRRWREAIHDGGRLLLGVPCEPGFRELRALTGEGPLHWRDEEQWLQIIQRAGFTIDASAGLEHREVYPSALDFLRSLHASGVTGEPRLSVGELRSLLAEYARRFPAPQGGVIATWAWLMVDARR